jgi:hypothetical protein
VDRLNVELDLAEMTRLSQTGSTLTRPLAETAWQIPGDIRLVREPSDPSLEIAEPLMEGRDLQRVAGLVKDYLPALVWQHLRADGGFPADEADDRGVLEKFARLHDAPPERMLAFATQYGPLHLCEHSLPACHNPGWRRGNTTHGACRPLQFEPVAFWHHYARQVQAVLTIAAKLYRGELGAEDHWRAIFESDSRKIVPWWNRTPWSDRRMLAEVVGEWLALGAVHPTFRWTDQGPEVALEGWGVLGAVARQLTFTVLRSDGLAFCAGCGTPFSPKRRPAKNRRSWCPDCGKRAADRQAKRDQRERD